MDIRTLQYYLAVVRDGTISAAAESLHIAQPSLSRQMKDLEEELGVSLFVRGNRRITLTEEGMVLHRRAEEMVHLMQMTEEEVLQVKNKVAGNIRIGAGESQAFHYLSRTASRLSASFPDIRFHVTSGDTQDLMDELNNGLIDFAVIFSEPDASSYQSITLPAADVFGVLMRKDDPLAEKGSVLLSDLAGRPLIITRGAEPALRGIKALSGLRVIATYNLVYNASLMVEDGLGIALCFDRLVNTTGDSALTFRQLVPEFKVVGSLIWKKYTHFSPAVQLFIDNLYKITEKPAFESAQRAI